MTEKRYAACVAVLLGAIVLVASACVLCGCITIHKIEVLPNVRHDVELRFPASRPAHGGIREGAR